MLLCQLSHHFKGPVTKQFHSEVPEDFNTPFQSARIQPCRGLLLLTQAPLSDQPTISKTNFSPPIPSRAALEGTCYACPLSQRMKSQLCLQMSDYFCTINTKTWTYRGDSTRSLS